MPKQTLIFIAVPNGQRFRPDQRRWDARLSVFAALRLEEGAELSAFPDVADWPATLGTLAGLQVFWKDSAGKEHEIQDVKPELVADSATWRALLPGDTPVAPLDTAAAQSARAVLSYDEGKVLAPVRALWAEFLARDGTACTDAPSEFLGRHAALSAMVPFDSGDPSRISEIAAQWKDAGSELERFRLMIEPNDRSGTGGSDDEGPDKPGFDERLGFVLPHAALMRRLGLVFDLTFDASKFGVASEGAIRVVPNLTARLEGTVPRSPWSAFEIFKFEPPLYPQSGLRGFHPRNAEDAETNLTRGFYRLRDGIDFSQEDVVQALGSASLVVGRAANQKARPDLAAGPIEPPVLKTEGLALLHPDVPRLAEVKVARAKVLAALGRPLPADGEPTLWCEDLIRGHRVDVRDGAGSWRSLCRREVTFHVGDLTPEPATVDEGQVEPAPETATDEELTAYKISNALFRWDGWSLVISPPAPPIDDPDSAEDADDVPFHADQDVADGSLERLRFGRDYAFRVRTVDLAGNAWSVDEANEISDADPDSPFVSPSETFLRREPLVPPTLVIGTAPGHGEPANAIVVGNERDGATKNEARDLVLPPRADWSVCERGGLLDGLSAHESWALIDSHRGSPPDGYDEAVLAALRRPDGVQIRTPYLPDPLATAAVLADLPGSAETIGPVSFAVSPDGGPDAGALAQSFQLVLRRGSDATPSARRTAEGVEVTLPPGSAHTISLASYPAPAALAHLAQAHESSPDDMTAAERLGPILRAGAHPMIAARKRLKLVHAVAQPLAAAGFVAPEVRRTLGNTTAQLSDSKFQVHAGSTARIDVDMAWTDLAFDPETHQYVRVPSQRQAFSLDIPEGQDFPLVSPPEGGTNGASGLDGSRTLHDFPDTRRRMVKYRATATTRFRSYYPDAIEQSAFTRLLSEREIDVPSSARPAPPEVDVILPTFRREERDRGGQGRVRKSHGGGLRIYLRHPWFSSGPGEQLGVVLSPVGSSEKPQATRWGGNPVKGRHLPTPFPIANDMRDKPDIEPLELPVEAATLRRSTSSHSVEVALYSPRFHGDGRAFVDVELNPGLAFWPFVELSLVRYQQNALDDAKVSAPVRAGFAQLGPDRTLTVKRDGTNAQVVLSGNSYRDGPEGDRTSDVELQVEVRDPTIDDPVLGWRPLGAAVALAAEKPLTGVETTWCGRVALGEASGPRRLTIREYARFEAGETAGAQRGPTGENPGARLVFADAIELDVD